MACPQLAESVTVYPSNWGETSKAEAITYESLIALVAKMNTWDRRITCVVHPDAMGVIESEKFGNIRTERGEPGYFVSISEKRKDPDGNELPFVEQRTERVKLCTLCGGVGLIGDDIAAGRCTVCPNCDSH